MGGNIRIQSALISVFHKEGLEPLVRELITRDVVLYSTGGTAEYLRTLGAEVIEVADLTGYPSILGGRVKTLHPKVHGGILARRGNSTDVAELTTYDIPVIDLVIVDLYPFEATVKSGAEEAEIIEKIDIGGIALIRAAAKNFEDVTCIPSQKYYAELTSILTSQEGVITLSQRKLFAGAAFDVSSHYDSQIFRYLNPESPSLKISHPEPMILRYGENPHQKGYYYGDINEQFEQLNGKTLSYNNLVDIDSALQLTDEFSDPFFAIIKHTNPCGCAVGKNLLDAWNKALAGDPVSAFGGVLACNRAIDKPVAEAIDKLFFEVLIAPDFSTEALQIFRQKKNRILLKRLKTRPATQMIKTAVNGILVQDRDSHTLTREEIEVKTSRKPNEQEISDIIFGDTICKHLKSNAIAIVKEGQLLGSGVGQTSRVDAIRQAIRKSTDMGFDLKDTILASDAFFPFKDSVEIAHAHGIRVIIEPGGSMRDEETINFCETNDMCLIFTGVRHFKH
ncbi:MAG: bifunctional phosphoribosylaminoimidazolecarboxamide formyltransferase/IMP cyclohydrolase [Bacteroidia bacterium]|nr:bifunctional phosphoribosylaminoimidazolecarboxamide formyltransferase/IMP cyclohydrolase [Bacteroidia bacterium]